MRYPSLLISAWLLLFATELLAPQSARTTTITIVNLDGAGEGFNDTSAPDPASTAGDNSGMPRGALVATLGGQRQIAAQFAADIWADLLSSNVPILINAKFDPPNPNPPDPLIPADSLNRLNCDAARPVIATGDANTFHGAFKVAAGKDAPLKDTWYPQALANSIAGVDLDSLRSDIRVYFNSSVGTADCLPNNGWYYGLDGNPPAGQFDFVTIALREIGRGLGFKTPADLATGAKLAGFNDVFLLNLKDISTGELYSEMIDAERVDSAKNTGKLRWIGTKVVAAHGGDVPMYAPPTIDPDFSVSNWDTSLSPDELMVPFYSGANHAVGLALQALEDIGWTLDPGGSVKIVALDAAVKEGAPTGFLVHRTGPTDQALTVFLKVSGTATSGDDYNPAISASVEIPFGEPSVNIDVTPIFDAVTKEKNETVIVTLQADTAYTLGFPSTATVTILNNVLAFGKEIPPQAEIGVPYTFDLPVSGGEEPYQFPLQFAKGSLPDGLTLSDLTIQGTPSSVAKTASFTITVKDQKNVSVSKKYKITVLKAVNIATTSLKNGQINKAYKVTLKANGGQKAYTWSVSSGALPASLQLVPETGTIAGTPVPSDVGSYPLNFKVTDALGGTNEQPLTLTIN